MADNPQGIDIPVKLDAEQATAGFAQIGEAAASSSKQINSAMSEINAAVSSFVDTVNSAAAAQDRAAQSTNAWMQADLAALNAQRERVLSLTQESQAASQEIDGINRQIAANQELARTIQAVTEGKAKLTLAGADAYEAAKQEYFAQQQNIDIYNQTTTGTDNVTSSVRGFRYAAMEGVVGLQMLQIALGQTSPAAQEASKGLMMVADSMMAGAMIGDVPGAVIGALVGVVLALGTASQSVDPNIQQLNKNLDNLAKHEDATTALAQLGNVEDTVAANALAYAKTNQDYAASLDQVTHSAEQSTNALSQLGDWIGGHVSDMSQLGDIQHAAANAAVAYAQALAAGESPAEASAAAQQRYREVLSGVTDAARAAEDAVLELGNTQERTNAFNKAALPLLDQYNSAQTEVTNKSVDLAKQDRDAANQRANSIRELDYSTAQSRMQADQQLTDQLTENQYSITELHEKTGQEIANDERDLTNKLNDLAWSHEHQQEAADLQRQQSANNTALEIWKNRADLALSLAQVDFSTQEASYKAQSYSQYLEIERRGQFERDQTQQRADINLTEIEKRTKNEQDLATKKQALDDATYQHEVDIEKRNMAIKEDDQKKQAQEQEDNLQHQADLDRHREQERLSAIDQQYNHQLARINETYTEATDKYAEDYKAWEEQENKKVDKIMVDMKNLEAQYPDIYALTALPASLNIASSIPYLGGYAGGANFVVPGGFPNDTALMGVSTGEKVSVTPAGQSGSMTVTTPIQIILDGRVIQAAVVQAMAVQDSRPGSYGP